jgi:YopX protein
MTRKIKFRGWHQGVNKMFSAEELAEDQLTLLSTGKFINVNSIDTRLSEIYENILPLQFTGLVDKNGREIYDGDIVSNETFPKLLVNWMEKYLSWTVSDLNLNVGFLSYFDNFVVIGNQFENPELLENKS